MDILSIGNSFSQDAQRYLHQIARADGVLIQNVNLYIGGCSLGSHFRYMKKDDEVYSLENCGIGTQFNVSLKKALLNHDWDVVTIQQVSHESPYYEKISTILK